MKTIYHFDKEGKILLTEADGELFITLPPLPKEMLDSLEWFQKKVQESTGVPNDLARCMASSKHDPLRHLAETEGESIMKRESIFAQIERHERFRRKMEARHAKHTASGKRRPKTCFHCRLEIAREKRSQS